MSEVEEMLIAAGAVKIEKKRFFCECDKDGKASEMGIQEQSFVDCNGKTTNPCVWIPPGKEFRCYNEDELTVIEQKIRDKEAPLSVTAEKLVVKK